MESLLKKYKLIIFDLDNTLYDEEDFLFQSYKYLCLNISKNFMVDYSNLYSTLTNIYYTEGRVQLFQKVLDRIDIPQITTSHMLNIFRSCKSHQLDLYYWVQQCFSCLKSKKINVAICTNGNVEQQKYKINSLNLGHIDVEYANLSTPKPSPIPLLRILEKKEILSTNTLFIGDSEIDKSAAIAAKVDFMTVYEWEKIFTTNCK